MAFQLGARNQLCDACRGPAGKARLEAGERIAPEGRVKNEIIAISARWNRKGLISETGQHKQAFDVLASWYRDCAADKL